METFICRVCGKNLPITDRVPTEPTRCRLCRNEYERQHRKNNPRVAAREHLAAFRYRQQSRMTALVQYGGDPPRCACCGEATPEFLAIDHINGGGNRDRKQSKKTAGINWYHWLKQQGWPTGFQVLCFNCNAAKAYYKICPHQRLIKEEMCGEERRVTSDPGEGERSCSVDSHGCKVKPHGALGQPINATRYGVEDPFMITYRG